MSIYDIIYSIYRNHSLGVHTHSHCECGRQSRRGDGFCDLCLTDKLVCMGMNRRVVDDWINLIKTMRVMETAMIKKAAQNGAVT